VFFLSAGMYIAGNIFYLIFGTGEEQPWNKIPDEEEPVNNKTIIPLVINEKR